MGMVAVSTLVAAVLWTMRLAPHAYEVLLATAFSSVEFRAVQWVYAGCRDPGTHGLTPCAQFERLPVNVYCVGMNSAS